ncbi:MAG TPA: (2Fe-2S) ferredoxin domain-containing protein, partial [Anaerolineae bacterium]|nr:(2Fe-2S) ferredoxin domain-containing protein [Anaerolineae bacterium]
MMLDELLEIRKAEQERKQKFKHKVNVCMASGCLSLRSDQVKDSLTEEVKQHGRENDVLVERVGCVGLCSQGPIVVVESKREVYDGITPGDAEKIIKSLDKKTGRKSKKAGVTGAAEESDGGNVRSLDAPFFMRQKKIVLEHSGLI